VVRVREHADEWMQYNIDQDGSYKYTNGTIVKTLQWHDEEHDDINHMSEVLIKLLITAGDEVAADFPAFHLKFTIKEQGNQVSIWIFDEQLRLLLHGQAIEPDVDAKSSTSLVVKYETLSTILILHEATRMHDLSNMSTSFKNSVSVEEMYPRYQLLT
jgi:hypothetical protein